MDLSICKTKPTSLDDNDIFGCSSDPSISAAFHKEKNKHFAFLKFRFFENWMKRRKNKSNKLSDIIILKTNSVKFITEWLQKIKNLTEIQFLYNLKYFLASTFESKTNIFGFEIHKCMNVVWLNKRLL
jgi:hypothetical protein